MCYAADMLDENKKRKLEEILGELAELDAKDKDSAIIQPRNLAGNEPLVPIPIEELFAYGKRWERRKALHEELALLAREA
jgi:hypothetical protein